MLLAQMPIILMKYLQISVIGQTYLILILLVFTEFGVGSMGIIEK